MEFYHRIQETRTLLVKEFMITGNISKSTAISYSQAFVNRMILYFFIEAIKKKNDNDFFHQMHQIVGQNNHFTRNSSIIFKELKKLISFQDDQYEFLQKNRSFSIITCLYDLPPNCRIDDLRESTLQNQKVKSSESSRVKALLDDLPPEINPIFQNLFILASLRYGSEITVYTLGTIFEQSITEGERLLEQEESQRKKCGIYYTPEFITDYITRHTLIPYLSSKNALSIEELVAEYESSIEILEKKLHSVKILDNACGSGAFLVKTAEILLLIHQEVARIKDEKIDNGSFHSKFTTELATIYSTNIFGVDLSQKAIEIAKLSIFLDLEMNDAQDSIWEKNLKVGDSLFDHPVEDPTLNFDWKSQFPTIIDRGGFDILIGNPPYIDIKELSPGKVKLIFQKYKTTHNRMNIYATFIERGLTLLKPQGYLGYIVPNSILYNSSYKFLRILLLQKTEILQIVKLPDDVFLNAKVETIIFTLMKGQKKDKECEILIFPRKSRLESIHPTRAKKHFFINNEDWRHNLPDSISQSKQDPRFRKEIYPLLLIDRETRILLDKIDQNSVSLGTPSNTQDALCDFSLGITPYDKYCGHTVDQIQNKVFHSSIKLRNEYKPLLRGEDIIPFGVFWKGDHFIRYGNWLGSMREERFFSSKHIVIRQILSGNPPRIYAGLVENQALYNTQIAFNLLLKKDQEVSFEYLLGILNSKLMTYYHKNRFLDETKILFQKILIQNAKKLPIRLAGDQLREDVTSVVKRMMNLIQKRHDIQVNLLKALKSRFKLKKITRKMQRFPEITLKILMKEIENQTEDPITGQQKKRLTREWTIFQNQSYLYQDEVDKLKLNLDKSVWNIYGLTTKETELIEEDFSGI